MSEEANNCLCPCPADSNFPPDPLPCKFGSLILLTPTCLVRYPYSSTFLLPSPTMAWRHLCTTNEVNAYDRTSIIAPKHKVNKSMIAPGSSSCLDWSESTWERYHKRPAMHGLSKTPAEEHVSNPACFVFRLCPSPEMRLEWTAHAGGCRLQKVQRPRVLDA